jgi:O-antigen/teichoic acid export membrane protein
MTENTPRLKSGVRLRAVMSIHKDIARNTIIHITGKMLGLVLSLIGIAAITRYLGLEGFGYYITAAAFLQFFGILVDFGFTLTTVQMIAKPGIDINRVMNSILSFRVLSAGIFLLLAPIVVWFFPYNIFIKLGVLITVASFFCVSVIQTMTGLFQQKMKMFQLTVAEVVGRMVFVGMIFLAIFLKLNIYWIFGAMTISSVINLALVFFYAKNHISWKWEIDFAIWKELIQRSWPIAISISFNLIYLRMDAIILSLSRTQSEVGLYGATYRVIDILTMLPAVFMGIVLPVAAQYFIDNKKVELKNLLQKAFDVLMIFSVPIVFGTFLISRPLMVFIAGEQFILSGDILQVLIVASGAIFATSLFSYAVVAVNKQKSMMWGYLFAAITTLVGYLIFIPKFGYWGASWMTIYSEFLILVWSAIMVYKTIKFFPSLKIFLSAIPAALIMIFVLNFFNGLHVIWLLLIAGVVYFSFLYLFGGIKKGTVRGLLR